MAEKSSHKRDKATIDKCSLWGIHILLILICVFSTWENLRPLETTKKAKPETGLSKSGGTGISLPAKADMSASTEVVRGERGMNAIYVMYGIATIAITLAVQVAETAKGSKSGLVIMDYAILTYLFFFNSWLRNTLLSKIFAAAITF